jgi:hypothetical protein
VKCPCHGLHRLLSLEDMSISGVLKLISYGGMAAVIALFIFIKFAVIQWV